MAFRFAWIFYRPPTLFSLEAPPPPAFHLWKLTFAVRALFPLEVDAALQCMQQCFLWCRGPVQSVNTSSVSGGPSGGTLCFGALPKYDACDAECFSSACGQCSAFSQLCGGALGPCQAEEEQLPLVPSRSCLLALIGCFLLGCGQCDLVIYLFFSSFSLFAFLTLEKGPWSLISLSPSVPLWFWMFSVSTSPDLIASACDWLWLLGSSADTLTCAAGPEGWANDRPQTPGELSTHSWWELMVKYPPKCCLYLVSMIFHLYFSLYIYELCLSLPIRLNFSRLLFLPHKLILYNKYIVI